MVNLKSMQVDKKNFSYIYLVKCTLVLKKLIQTRKLRCRSMHDLFDLLKLSIWHFVGHKYIIHVKWTECQIIIINEWHLKPKLVDYSSVFRVKTQRPRPNQPRRPDIMNREKQNGKGEEDG